MAAAGEKVCELKPRGLRVTQTQTSETGIVGSERGLQPNLPCVTRPVLDHAIIWMSGEGIENVPSGVCDVSLRAVALLSTDCDITAADIYSLVIDSYTHSATTKTQSSWKQDGEKKSF